MPQTSSVPSPLLVRFAGGDEGEWEIHRSNAVIGAPLPVANRLAVTTTTHTATDAAWSLKGVVSNMRYTTSKEATLLVREQPPLSRPEAVMAALIPIRKSATWWAMAQDERRAIYEERSRHTSVGLEYLPRIARRLHHSRDLGEPFDFLTWFEFAPEHEPAFDELVERLRASEEWNYVEREVDIRLKRRLISP